MARRLGHLHQGTVLGQFHSLADSAKRLTEAASNTIGIFGQDKIRVAKWLSYGHLLWNGPLGNSD